MLNSHAWDALLARKFDFALSSAQRAIDIGEDTEEAQERLSLMTNKAHALMFLDRLDEALEIYRSGRGKTLDNKERWEDVMMNDFVELRKAGLSHPLMAKISAEFTEKK